MQVLNKYRLELHWVSVSYNREDVAVLRGAYFSGPVLQDAEQVQIEDNLTLDMTDQHLIFPPMDGFYQVVLNWKGVEYREGKIFLKEAYVQGKYVNSIETLENNDWILIDCREHDTKKMAGKRGRKVAPGTYETLYKHALVYQAKIMKAKGEDKF